MDKFSFDAPPKHHRFVDKTGLTFKNLKVICYWGKLSGKHAFWCQCLSCGTLKAIPGSNLAKCKTCGCARNSQQDMAGCQYFVPRIHPQSGRARFKDITGESYGDLRVLGFLGIDKKGANWLCQCSCGGLKKSTTRSLNAGHTKSCGCLKARVLLERNKKNASRGGISRHPYWGSYAAMIERCYNPNHNRYQNYGGRGIAVCERWRNNPWDFVKDMGDKGDSNMSVDRIDVNGDYTPENCRWANAKQQARNTTRNVLSKMESKKIRELQKKGIGVSKIVAVMNKGRANPLPYAAVWNVASGRTWT